MSDLPTLRAALVEDSGLSCLLNAMASGMFLYRGIRWDNGFSRLLR